MEAHENKGHFLNLIPPTTLTDQERLALFQHFLHRLAAHRNRAEMFAHADYTAEQDADRSDAQQVAYDAEINRWAQVLLENAWAACQEPSDGDCPKLGPLADTSTAGLPPLPDQAHVCRFIQTTLFLNLTEAKSYHAHTRAFLSTLGPLDENAVAVTLKDPERAVQEAGRTLQEQTDNAKDTYAQAGSMFRKLGVGLAAVGGGVLVGVTGGLAAPLVGAGVSTVLGSLGIGGTAAGLLASGLAGSSVVCGALFGAYGSRRSAAMIRKYTQEVRDLAILPVRPVHETLAVRLCVSGWLDSHEDVSAPWTVFGDDDTFALQWEVEALMDLSNALRVLIKSQAMQYVKAQIIKRTVFAALAAALSPTAWLKIGQLIDNPWMTARARATKAGKVLGMLLAQRVLGTRPLTLVGYSLGAQVVFEALRHLASLAPADAAPLVQDVFLLGAPVPADAAAWAAVRRVVAGRVINAYSTRDYVLAVLARASGGTWEVAGLQPVVVQGVENVECSEVVGHSQWRGMVGRCLQACRAPGIHDDEVELQLARQDKADDEMEMTQRENETVILEGTIPPRLSNGRAGRVQ